MKNINDYYCSQKFWWLSVDIEKGQASSCCSALPHNIDLTSDLFNSEILITERRQMLNNQPVESCKQTCWIPESEGRISRRQILNSTEITHTQLENDPEILNVLMGKQCNLNCVYCSKNYSSSWAKDLLDNGDYVGLNDSRYKLETKDKIFINLSHSTIQNSNRTVSILEKIYELSKSATIKKVIVSGGEPFLYNALSTLVNKFKCPVEIYTGLGINERRFQNELMKFDKNVSLVISAETTGKVYEFIRTGNSWKRFLNNLEYLNKTKIDYGFSSTISNLTIFDISNFLNMFPTSEIKWNICSDPIFLQLHNLDYTSKDTILNNIDFYPQGLKDIIINNLNVQPNPYIQKDLKIFILQFCDRNKLDLSVFPMSFVNWIKNVV